MKVTYLRIGSFVELVRIVERGEPGSAVTKAAAVAKAVAAIEDTRQERLPWEVRRLLAYGKEIRETGMKIPA